MAKGLFKGRRGPGLNKQAFLEQLKARADAGDEVAINFLQNTPGIAEEFVPKAEIWHGTPHEWPPVMEIYDTETGKRYFTDLNMFADWQQHPVVRKNPERFMPIQEHPAGQVDLSKLRTGEGANAYGAGFYGAEEVDVATGYRERLAGDHNREHDTLVQLQKIDEHIGNMLEGRTDPGADPAQLAAELFPDDNRQRLSLERNLKILNDDMDGDFSPESLMREKEKLERYVEMQKKDMEMLGIDIGGEAPGYLYKLELGFDPEQEMLQLEEPFSKQPEYVQQVLLEADPVIKGAKLSDALANGIDVTAREIYYNIRPEATDPMEASKALNELGIKGIRYPDELSRPDNVMDKRFKKLVEKHGLDDAIQLAVDTYHDTPANKEKYAQHLRDTWKKPTHNLVLFDNAQVRVAERNGLDINAVYQTAEETGQDPQTVLGHLVGKGTPLGALLLGGAAYTEDADANMLTTLGTLNRLKKIGYVTDESAKNPQALKKAMTRYEKSLKNKAFATRELEAAEGDYITTYNDIADESMQVDMDELKGGVGIPIKSDTSAIRTIEKVGGRTLEKPVESHGGFQYSQKQDGWASNYEIASRMVNKARKAQEAHPDRKVYGVVNKMAGDTSIDFSVMPTEQILMDVQSRIDQFPKEVIQKFDTRMRQSYPEWLGLEHPGAGAQLGLPNTPMSGTITPLPGGARTVFTNIAKMPGYQDQGFPIYSEIQDSIVHERMRGAGHGDAGMAIFEFPEIPFKLQEKGDVPQEHLDFLEESVNPSYSKHYGGQYRGETPKDVPAEVMFPDPMKHQDTRKTKGKGEPRPLKRQEKIDAINSGTSPETWQLFDDDWFDGVMDFIQTSQNSLTPGQLISSVASMSLGDKLYAKPEDPIGA